MKSAALGYLKFKTVLCPIADINWSDKTTKATVVGGDSRRVGFLRSYSCLLVKSTKAARLASFVQMWPRSPFWLLFLFQLYWYFQLPPWGWSTSLCPDLNKFEMRSADSDGL